MKATVRPFIIGEQLGTISNGLVRRLKERKKRFSCLDLRELKYQTKWDPSRLNSDSENFRLKRTFKKRRAFHSHQEILLFLFYQQLKSVILSNLFTYSSDTTIHTHPWVYIHIRYSYAHSFLYRYVLTPMHIRIYLLYLSAYGLI